MKKKNTAEASLYRQLPEHAKSANIMEEYLGANEIYFEMIKDNQGKDVPVIDSGIEDIMEEILSLIHI